MSQRFRRNIAPVLGALLLLAAGLGAWVMLSVHQTRTATEDLHAQFAPDGSPWRFQPPQDGFAAFVYRSGERVCATLSLLPEAATLTPAGGEPRQVRRAALATLLAEVPRLAEDCDTLEVMVFASRMPYHGRFVVRYGDGTVRHRGAPEFGG